MKRELHPLTPQDLYRLRQLTAIDLSPDGHWLATAIESVDRKRRRKTSHLFLQSTGGGILRQFTRGEAMDRQPRFSPDGKHLAFLSNRSGKTQVHLIPVDGGESRQLTHLEGEVSSAVWSPDCRWLCVVLSPTDAEAVERERQRRRGREDLAQATVRSIDRLLYRLDGVGFLPLGRSELHLVRVSTGKTRVLVADGTYNEAPVFDPAGASVLFSSNKHPDAEREPMRADLWRVDLEPGAEPRLIPTHPGPALSPSPSPDGSWLAFRGHPSPDLMDNERNAELFIVPAEGGTPVCLSSALDRTAENVSINDTWGMIESAPLQWDADGHGVYSQVTRDGNTEVHRFGCDGTREVLVDLPGVVLDFRVSHERGRILFAHSAWGTPGELYSQALDGGRQRRLTRVNPWLGGRRLAPVEELWVDAPEGHRIQGWVMLPPDRGPQASCPGILYVRGGPHLAYARALMHEFQYLAGAGYAVFFCNPRGSQGYGAEFVRCIAEGWGGRDYRDLMTFTDAVLAHQSSIDPTRLGVTGGSYGGFMTNWIIGHTDRFRAAVTQRSVSNFLSFMGSSDCGYNFHYGLRSRGLTPWQDVARFVDLSPMKYLPDCRTPTLVIHSENDLRCPIEQGEQVYVQLKLQGVPTEMVRFPEESHGLSRGGRTDRRIERLERIRGWFDRYLLFESAATADSR